jgi:hypothetical protein
MAYITLKGSFKNTDAFLQKASKLNIIPVLEAYARRGVEALASATPVRSGLTADSWGYEVTKSGGTYSITWTNSNVVDGVAVAILLEFGHATGTGGYVQGEDYINPVLRPIFEQIENDVWKAVTSA